jgi:integrase/recombinase XerD
VRTAGGPSTPAADAAVTDTNTWTLGRALEEFLVARASAKDSPHTTKAYRNDAVEIGRRLAGTLGFDPAEWTTVELDRISVPLLRRAFADFASTHAKSSIARAWSSWNQLYTFLVGDDVVEGNPMAGLKRPQVPRPAPKPLTGEDTPEKLLTAVATGLRKARDPWPERDFAIIATLLVTGVRSAELLGLRLESLTGRPGERSLVVLGKRDKTRSVPFEPALEDVLEQYLVSRRLRFPTERLRPNSTLFVDTHGEPLREGGLRYLVRHSYNAAGITGHVPKGALVHALRHTCATRLAEDGATASEIQTIFGHGSIVTSQGYIDSTNREQRAAAGANRTYRIIDQVLGDRT